MDYADTVNLELYPFIWSTTQFYDMLSPHSSTTTSSTTGSRGEVTSASAS